MPEMRFVIAWPDGREETCYSPSLVIRDSSRKARSIRSVTFFIAAGRR